MPTPDLVAGDFTKFVRTCKRKSDKTVIDLTGATVVLRYKANGGAVVERTMTVLSPATDGKVDYSSVADELVKGTVEGALKITDSSGQVFRELEPWIRNVRGKL